MSNINSSPVALRLRFVARINNDQCSSPLPTDPQMSVGASDVEPSLHPRPIQIVLAKPDHTFELDLEALREILLSDDMNNRKVMVLSVAGAFRKGKSFLLDYLLRYLNNGVSCKSTLCTVEVT